MPLFAFFDDVELGNALGTHAGTKEVGVVNITIPCLPPNYASKLESYIVCDLFHSKDRKVYGNESIFRRFLAELKNLRENGIRISVNGIVHKIYFITSLSTWR